MCTYTYHAACGTVWNALDAQYACRVHATRFLEFLAEVAPDAGQDRWHATTILAWLGY